MAKIGAADVFERRYMQKFRAFASAFGEFVSYERDRGARDIGIHLTHRLKGGAERMSAALCWFQMKGIMKSTLSQRALGRDSDIKVSLEVGHLKYWYLQPVPTHLVVYVESVDKFYVLNLHDYIEQKWGRAILTHKGKTLTVAVPKSSELDEQAFRLILKKSDLAQWAKAISIDTASAKLCHNDYNLIWHFGTARKRKATHQIVFWDWISKTRGQLFIQERESQATEWITLREHWQYMMNVSDLSDAYPYLSFHSQETEHRPWYWDEEDNDLECRALELEDGTELRGVNRSDEYCEFVIGCKLNRLGRDLFRSVMALKKLGLLEITPGESEIVSVAPWDARAV